MEEMQVALKGMYPKSDNNNRTLPLLCVYVF